MKRNLMKINEQGQVFSYDFFVAFIIFLFLTAAMLLTWEHNVDRIREIMLVWSRPRVEETPASEDPPVAEEAGADDE